MWASSLLTTIGKVQRDVLNWTSIFILDKSRLGEEYEVSEEL